MVDAFARAHASLFSLVNRTNTARPQNFLEPWHAACNSDAERNSVLKPSPRTIHTSYRRNDMQTLKIKDLEVAKEMSREEQAAVSGGDNVSLIANGPVTAVGGLFASPALAVGATNVVTQNDNDTDVKVDTTTFNNLLQGSIAQIGQFKA
jgi:hypothetical protein